MDIWVGLLILVVALAGFFAGRYFAPNQQKLSDLTNQVAEQQAAHQAYREQVAEHMAGSARKFSKITQEYRELHDHLATGAQELCERRSIPRELSTSHVNIMAVESPSYAPELETVEDSDISEPVMVDVSKAGLSPISQTNQAILEEHIHKSNPLGAVVIDLDAQRQESVDTSDFEPAKDYAIKEKGVINHNSLNRDDVKT